MDTTTPAPQMDRRTPERIVLAPIPSDHARPVCGFGYGCAHGMTPCPRPAVANLPDGPGRTVFGCHGHALRHAGEMIDRRPVTWRGGPYRDMTTLDYLLGRDDALTAIENTLDPDTGEIMRVSTPGGRMWTWAADFSAVTPDMRAAVERDALRGIMEAV